MSSHLEEKKWDDTCLIQCPASRWSSKLLVLYVICELGEDVGEHGLLLNTGATTASSTSIPVSLILHTQNPAMDSETQLAGEDKRMRMTDLHPDVSR